MDFLCVFKILHLINCYSYQYEVIEPSTENEVQFVKLVMLVEIIKTVKAQGALISGLRYKP